MVQPSALLLGYNYCPTSFCRVSFDVVSLFQSEVGKFIWKDRCHWMSPSKHKCRIVAPFQTDFFLQWSYHIAWRKIDRFQEFCGNNKISSIIIMRWANMLFVQSRYFSFVCYSNNFILNYYSCLHYISSKNLFHRKENIILLIRTINNHLSDIISYICKSKMWNEIF